MAMWRRCRAMARYLQHPSYQRSTSEVLQRLGVPRREREDFHQLGRGRSVRQLTRRLFNAHGF